MKQPPPQQVLFRIDNAADAKLEAPDGLEVEVRREPGLDGIAALAVSILIAPAVKDAISLAAKYIWERFLKPSIERRRTTQGKDKEPNVGVEVHVVYNTYVITTKSEVLAMLKKELVTLDTEA